MPFAHRRVLIFSEAVTLAHLARPLALLGTIEKESRDIHFACPNNHFRKFLGFLPYPIYTLESMSPARFLRALNWGRPIYTTALLKQYIQEDLALIERIQPDVVVGDFRLSLSISARMASVEYHNITNAYWRPEYRPVPPRPVLKPMRFLPTPVADALYRASIEKIFRLHAKPFNQARRSHGLPELPPDVRYFYTDGDVVLYADRRALYPDFALPDGHCFLGPLLWAPSVPPPDWWERVPRNRPVIYVALGSSGNHSAFQILLNTLSRLPVAVIAATGEGAPAVEENRYLAPWLDGNAACRRASLLICNGGVMSCHQALEAGIPVIGVCSNMDQFLSMQVMEENRLGHTIRADEVDAHRVVAVVERLLSERDQPDSPFSQALRQITAGSTAEGKK